MNDRRGAASAIGWTLLSILVPGAAHLRAGHRVVGFGLLALFLGTAALASGLVAASGGLAVLTQSSWTKAVAGWAIGVGVAWALLVVISYVTLRPRRMLLWSDAVALVLVGAVLSPFVLASQAVSEVDNTLGDVFTAPEEPAPIDHADPWAGRTRINILLLGGDGASTRAGESIRTDSINVASIDVKTGDTVMFALPRELENTPFPQGSVMRRLFPPPKNFYMEGPERGNSDLLNSVWEYADTHPEYFRNSPTRAPVA
ncbi:MAG: LytR family transcriptional regulator, partial [Nonomuraea sp.]|nr:LytR family transcriptional regulator [Nonomuraea sp.]